jgi:hypothetical protein
VWKLLLEVDAVTVASEGWVPQLRGLYTTGWDSTCREAGERSLRSARRTRSLEEHGWGC